MNQLRDSKLIASLVLAWFVLFLGSAAVSSIVKPDIWQVVCTSGGLIKLVSVDNGDAAHQGGHSMDCPLCASVIALPFPWVVNFEKPSSLAHALRPIAAAHIAFLTAPPLPSRGPPASFA